MSLVRLENVHKSFDTQSVLEGVDLRIEEGERIGLIGRNGTGKSTIFRLILGQTEAGSGTIERMKRARFACLEQLPDVDGETSIHDMVMEPFAELVAMEEELHRLAEQLADADDATLHRYSELQDRFHIAGGYEFRARAAAVLTGLGFSEEEFGLPVNALSGGQRRRLMLALLLLRDADLILLDEPENHLDLKAREWLEDFLRGFGGAFVIISHDRQMLNAVVDRVVELELGQLTSYAGNYQAFLEAKALRREQHEKAYARQQEYIDKEMRLINRFRYKATKAKQMQGRLKQLEKMERIEAPPPEAGDATFKMGDVVRSGTVVLEGRDLSMAYGDLRLYSDFDLAVRRGERIGIIGPNGSGKTTLLRHLAGRLDGGRGDVTVGHKVRLGFYDQHHGNVNPANDILTEVHRARPDWQPEQIRTFLGSMLFRGDDVFKPIEALSGGELSRVALAKLILSQANVLLLDEPTNHLDIASREALENALAGYGGTLVMVSHDRTLIDRFADRLVVVAGGQATVHLGNYSDYRAAAAPAEDQADEQKTARAQREEVLRIRQGGGEKARPASSDRKQSEREQRKRRRRLEQVEQGITDLESVVEEYEGRFASLDPQNFEAARRLKEEYDGLKDDLAEMYAEWERLAEETGEG
jgi:ATP-binding cassette subfamily F protein 3